ncbi:hypothetical protein MTO96_034293 [Rhipicephalus appendiculatus]
MSGRDRHGLRRSLGSNDDGLIATVEIRDELHEDAAGARTLEGVKEGLMRDRPIRVGKVQQGSAEISSARTSRVETMLKDIVELEYAVVW